MFNTLTDLTKYSGPVVFGDHPTALMWVAIASILMYALPAAISVIYLWARDRRLPLSGRTGEDLPIEMPMDELDKAA